MVIFFRRGRWGVKVAIIHRFRKKGSLFFAVVKIGNYHLLVIKSTKGLSFGCFVCFSQHEPGSLTSIDRRYVF